VADIEVLLVLQHEQHEQQAKQQSSKEAVRQSMQSRQKPACKADRSQHASWRFAANILVEKSIHSPGCHILQLFLLLYKTA